MRFFEIKVDEEVMGYLKRNAIPFEDTPNTALRRILGLDKKVERTDSESKGIKLPTGTSAALQQILEVIHQMNNNGGDRNIATNFVAKERGITTQSVIDKYTRQLGIRASGFDRLTRPENVKALSSLLKERFPQDAAEIDDFFKQRNLA